MCRSHFYSFDLGGMNMFTQKITNVSSLLLLIFTGFVNCQCPSGWTQHEDSCYFLHTHDKYSWPESMVFCKGHHAHLVYVETKAENDYIKGMLAEKLSNSSDSNDHVWLGATDEIEERKFMWYGVEQPVTFTDWGPHEPNSNPTWGREDCLVYWARYGWKWADLNCHNSHYFLCEKTVPDGNVIG